MTIVHNYNKYFLLAKELISVFENSPESLTAKISMESLERFYWEVLPHRKKLPQSHPNVCIMRSLASPSPWHVLGYWRAWSYFLVSAFLLQRHFPFESNLSWLLKFQGEFLFSLCFLKEVGQKWNLQKSLILCRWLTFPSFLGVL